MHLSSTYSSIELRFKPSPLEYTHGPEEDCAYTPAIVALKVKLSLLSN